MKQTNSLLAKVCKVRTIFSAITFSLLALTALQARAAGTASKPIAINLAAVNGGNG